MRKYRHLPRSIGVAAIACVLQATAFAPALAGPMTDDAARGSPTIAMPLPADLETAAVSAIAPAAAKPAPRADREAIEPGERTRIVSYLILRGLQGAGPFLGAR